MIRPTRKKTLTTVATKDIPKAKEEIKSKLPFLKSTDIRRHKIPYNESVILELHEEGSHEAVEYFKFLFDLDEETRNAAGPNTVIWNKPRLKYNTELIDQLRKVLTIFCQRTIPASTRTTALIDTAVFIQNLSWEWWWIAETLYRSAFWIAKEIDDNNKQIITILRYVYARFLYYQMTNAKAALEHVRVAQRDSRDKTWSASKILGLKQENLFRECCTLLHKVLLTIAQDVRESEVEVSVNSCKVALSSAIDSGHEESVAEAHRELGKSEIAAGNVKEAIKHFSKSLVILERIPDPQGICKTHSELALAYKAIGNNDKVLQELQKIKDVAIQFELQDKLAEAHYLTGEYYLSQENPKEATPNLEISFSLYCQLGAVEESNRARCLVGVSRGQEMMEAYRALLMRSVEGDANATLSIILWRDRGEAFEGVPMTGARADVFEEADKR